MDSSRAPNLSTLYRVLNSVCEFLDQHQIPYALAGGLAVAVWGQPRATYDVDIVVVGTRRLIEELRKSIQDSTLFAVEPHELPMHPKVPIMRANVRTGKSGKAALVTVDFLTVEESLAKSMLDRCIQIPVAGYPTRVSAAEDLVLLKLLSARTKDLEDCRGILQTQSEAFDHDYLEEWVERLGCREAWSKVVGS